MKALRLAAPSPYLFRPRSTFVPSLSARCFITPPIQTLHASRTLPYHSTAIYSIIADVAKYESFLPYCKSSKVTKWSQPDSKGKRWPSEAELVVGWKSLEETFKSKIYCVPGSIVEAVGGRTATTLKREDIEHHHEDKSGDVPSEGGILTHLLTRWTVRQFPYKPPPQESAGHPSKEHTEVSLAIEYQFSNPMYSAMSGAVADKVAGAMIEAFEARVKAVLDGGTDAHTKGTHGVLGSSVKA